MITSAISCSRSSMMRRAFSKTARRAYALVAAHSFWAAAAARYASSTSSTVAIVIEASFSPLYGLKSMMSQEPVPGRHSPSMYCCASSVK